MTKKLLGIILEINLLSLIFSSLSAWLYYQSTEGFELRQIHFMVFLMSILFSLINLLLSLSGLLNTVASIRQNTFASLLAFVGLPSIAVVCIVVLTFSDNVTESLDFSSLSLSFPFLFYVLGYFLFYGRIRRLMYKV